MLQRKLNHTIPDVFLTIKPLNAVLIAENDFITELHAERVLLTMPTLFNEEMSVKTASTADARQKRQR
ncbi:MAG: hypothetical protein LBU96_09915 [Yokenella regensburgei]|jgi:hypothetical protein|uniref:Uncharacterized protein n=1 Tax=Yokenella regensburgei TaxID=158877 RepID=A0AB38FSP1_9ENTR|nr:hypothetical protein [Yokenella regensburgei]EHM46273.1 hypothetical protein HMPREF0880_03543 [Yokenella regensburgei ATCC 43003]KFD20796.1 hypothetical protein GYRE_03800 [Yokenella regensburgei ATCC 49455]MDR3104753.1 hypothetical protein [Yokenella regensburgei]SQA60989.1 Uncharacterised protein [Yokenella regensburgei]SQA66992.1 Uncharacterised protein [Yokenella regensburgei]